MDDARKPVHETHAVAATQPECHDILPDAVSQLSVLATPHAFAELDRQGRHDPWSAGHPSRVVKLAVAMGSRLGLGKERLRGLELAATLHDIGMLCVPAEILAKPGRLIPAERTRVQMHAEAGAKLLANIEFAWPIQEMIWQHHERHDGSGYPRQLRGNQILLEAQIIGAADLVEAMSSHRPYRAPRGLPASLAELARQRGTHFDAAVVDACTDVFAQGFSFTGERAAA